MKRFTLIALCAAAAAAGIDAGAVLKVPSRNHTAPAKRTHAELKALLRAASENPLWRPATEKVYFYEEIKDDNGEVKGEWRLEDTYTLTYDQQGRRIMELCENAFDGFSKNNYTYDANGMLSTELTEVSEDGQKFENSTKTERSYDNKLTSVITNNRQWIWIDNDWNMAGNCYQRIITRDNDGNITSAVIAVLLDGKYDPTRRLDITYADGKAVTLKESELTYDGIEYKWVDGLTISDIVWNKTNGQIVSTEGLFAGDNRIASCTMTDEDVSLHYTVTYSEDGAYVANVTGNNGTDDLTAKIVYENDYDPEAYSSYRVTTTSDFMEGGEVVETTVEIVEGAYDKWGNILLEQASFGDGEFMDIEDRISGKPVYDTENGYPIEQTIYEYDYELMEDYPALRYTSEGYFDASAGIDDVTVDTDAPVEYFNLQGIRVANPSAGNIYIRRQGAKTDKVLVK